RRIALQRSSNRLLQIVDPVCRDPARIGGGVTGEIHDASHQPAIFPPNADHTHLRIDRPGVSHHVAIALLRMRKAEPVLHAQTPVESGLALDSETEAATR